MKWKKAKPELCFCFKWNTVRSDISLEAFIVTKFSDIFLGWQMHHVVQVYQYFKNCISWHQGVLVTEHWLWRQSQVSETLVIWTTDLAVMQGNFTELKIGTSWSTHAVQIFMHPQTVKLLDIHHFYAHYLFPYI